MRNVTLSADENLIRRAREKALREDVTLNGLFRQWLQRYIGQDHRGERFEDLMSGLDYANSGRAFSRDELNER